MLIDFCYSKLAGKDIGTAAAAIEQNIGEDEDEDELDVDDVPIFTPELAKLKAKEAGMPMPADDDDMAMEDGEDGEGNDYPDEFSDSEEEKEDYTIRKTDSIIVAATAESDHSNLEVYIYEHEKSNLYVHHEVILGAYPLCVEWIPKWQGNKANMIAVGTFLPEIEIWNLDSESCDPVTILGSLDLSEQAKAETSSAKSKYMKHHKPTMAFSEHTHTDSVMSLSLNPF